MRLKAQIVLITALCSIFFSATLLTGKNTTDNLTAIIGAMPEETSLIKSNIKNKTNVKYLGINFTKGSLKARNVVVVTGGIGKVNAAMVTTLLIEHFKPSEVIFSGIAGGINPKLIPGDIVIGTKTAQYDLGELISTKFKPFAVKNPANQKRNPIFFVCDPTLIELARNTAGKISLSTYSIDNETHKPEIYTGIIATGDKFIASKSKSNEIRKLLKADAVEMEGAAVGQICYQTKTPFILLRSISDNANNNAKIVYDTFIKTASKNSAKLTMALINEIQKSEKGK